MTHSDLCKLALKWLKKPHRAVGGVGDWRYYMAPEGMIAANELPQGWGLLEVNGRGHIKARAGHAIHFKGGYHELCRQGVLWKFHDVDIQREQFLLVRVMANTGDPQKTLDRLREANNINARLVSDLERLRGEHQRLLSVRVQRDGLALPIPRRAA